MRAIGYLALMISAAAFGACGTDVERPYVIGPFDAAPGDVPKPTGFDGVYQRAGWEPDAARHCDSLVRLMVARGIEVVDIWYPTSPSPCMGNGATSNIIVHVKRPDPRVDRFGFAATPDWMHVNCGVAGIIRFRIVI